MMFETSWSGNNLFAASFLIGLLGSSAMWFVLWRWPDPESDVRLYARLGAMALAVPALVASNPWRWLPAVVIAAVLLNAWIPIMVRRLKLHRLKRHHVFILLTVLMAGPLKMYDESHLADLALAHLVGFAPIILFVVTFLTSRARLKIMLASGAGLLVGLPVLGLGSLSFPIAYFLTHAPRGDRRAVAVILICLLLSGAAVNV